MNHPVHIITEDNQMSPSAFIPYCEFGGDTSAVGVKIDNFDFPVCKSFQAKILNDQLCYEVDLNRFSNKSNIAKELGLGFNFLMDYNEDRQFSFFTTENNKKNKFGLASSLVKSDENKKAIIHLNSIGNFKHLYVFKLLTHILFRASETYR